MRFLDVVFFLYFLTHIPIALLFDSQGVFPEQYYPKLLVDTKKWYCREFKDSLMIDPPSWFFAFLLCEVLLQFPFFFVATYAYLKGAAKSTWIRIPVIIYSSHVVTTLIAIFYHMLTSDFTNSKYPGPATMKERLTLMSIYSPYFIIPLLNLCDACFSSAYKEGKKIKRQ